MKRRDFLAATGMVPLAGLLPKFEGKEGNNMVGADGIKKHFIKTPPKPFIEIPLTIYWESVGPEYVYTVTRWAISVKRDNRTFYKGLDYYASSYEAYVTIPMLPLTCLKGDETHYLDKLSQELINELRPHYGTEESTYKQKPLSELICCYTDPTEMGEGKSSFFAGMVAY